jgi:hypothetical protein
MYFDFSTLISTLIESEKILDKLILLSILHSLYDLLEVLIHFSIIGKLAMLELGSWGCLGKQSYLRKY